MKIKSALTFILLYTALLSFSQVDFRPGFIIKNDGDTLHGQIDYRGDLSNGRECRFKLASTDSSITFLPGEISAYGFPNNKFYISKQIQDTAKFYEYLIKGELDVFYRRDEHGDHFYLEDDSLGFMELPYGKGIRTIDGIDYEYKNNQYIGLLLNYTRQAPDLRKKIEVLPKPDAQDLIRIAEDYHEEVCAPGEKCIVYRIKIPWLKVSLEPYAGIATYRGSKNVIPEYGGNVYFWLPRSNEKLYLKMGLGYLHLTDTSTYFSPFRLYKFPFQFSYIYPKGIFRPRAGIGINFCVPDSGSDDVYFIPFYTLELNVGATLRINKWIYLSVNAAPNFTPLTSVLIGTVYFNQFHFGLVSASFTGGIFIKL